MSQPPEAPIVSPPVARLSAGRFLVAVLLALGFFAAIWGTTWLAGFGRDLHALRVGAAAGVAFVAALLLLWPRRRRETRVAAIVIAFGLGALVWWSVPSRIGGINLLSATAKRDALHTQMGLVTFDDVKSAGQWRNSIDDLAAQFPTLAASLEPELARWSVDAEAAVLERLRETPSDEVATAHLVRARGIELGEHFPDRRKRIEDEFAAWVRRASLELIDELNGLRAADWDGFNTSSFARRKLVQAFPDSRERLAEAERSWVMKSVGAATASPLRALNANPRAVRDACREVEARIRSLKSVGPAAEEFYTARSTLFLLAHEAARLEVLGLIRAADYERAFTAALVHHQEWFSVAKQLGPSEVKGLTDLRDQARHLAIRFEKAGFVDSAPEPRMRETAPPPRAKQ